MRIHAFKNTLYVNCMYTNTPCKYINIISLPCAGVMDNSGFEFTYLDTPRSFDAGVISVGHQVTPTMVVPPDRDNFNISGVCSTDCTQVSFRNTFAYMHLHIMIYNYTHMPCMCLHIII